MIEEKNFSFVESEHLLLTNNSNFLASITSGSG
ncbi:MAG: hypothetical protein MRERV_14c068 [Mycoplasmataceae bacterium RV_VA103A]|nr:MAG: hypothetical protein MRERV_14c068 [Mycoplasmataceae bacterium RV_VA103A]